MSTFDDQRAIAIIKRAQEGEMYAEGAMPESESDRIIVAEQLVEQARQVEMVRGLWIEKEGPVEADRRVPHWPAVEKILVEANMLVGANEETAQTNGHIPEISQIEQQELPSAPTSSGEERAATGSTQSAPVPDPPPVDSLSQQEASVEVSGGIYQEPQKGEVWASENGQEWQLLSSGGGPMVDVMLVATGEKAQVPSGFLKRKVHESAVEKNVGRIEWWVDREKNAIYYQHVGCDTPHEHWIIPLDDCPLPDVTGETTEECPNCCYIAPLSRRSEISSQQAASELPASEEVIDDFSGKYEFLSNFSPSTIAIEGIDYPTVEHAFQAHKSNDPDNRRAVAAQSTPGWAKKAGRALDLRPDWEDVKNDVMRTCLAQKFAEGTELARRLLETGDARLVEGNTWGDDYWGVPRGGEGQNWLGRLLEERREFLSRHFHVPEETTTDVAAPKTEYVGQAASEQADQQTTGSDTSIPDHDDEGDDRYQTILEDTEERYTPAGMPIPHELDDPPDIMPEMLDQVPDVVAQRLHSQFNALAARAKYLHDVEDARARECGMIHKLFLRGAKRKAREVLGSSSTITEREEWSEDNDKDVRLWGERANKHREIARARKTFFDIYTTNVVVLSRDWTMRDQQKQN